MKRTIGTALLVGLVLTSGCLGFITGEKALKFKSGEVKVGQQALSETGYEQDRKESQVVTKNFTAAGQTRKVKVTNHIAEYKRTVKMPVIGTQELARFTVLATPKVTIAGQTFNPVSDLSNRELAKRLQKKYKSMRDVKPLGNRTVNVLGEGVRVSKFSAKATLEGGQTVDVYIHIAQTETDNDFVVAVSVYPQRLDGEQKKVNRLLRGIQHEPAAS